MPFLQKLLNRAFKDMKRELLKEEEKLDTTPGGLEIISLMDDVGPKMAKDLAIYMKTMRPENYNPRLFSFVRETEKSGKEFWISYDLQLAGPEHFTGDPDELRALMKMIADAGSRPSIGMWVSPMSMPHGFCYVAFLRHHDGQEAQYTLVENVWTCVPQNMQLRQSMLGALLAIDEIAVDSWKDVMAAQYEVMLEPLKDSLSESLKAKSIDLSEDEIKTICLQYITSMPNLKALQACARLAGTRSISESQLQLETMSRLLRSASDYNDQKIGQLEKDQERALKKFRSDFEKVKESGKLKDKRIANLSSEVTVLRRQLREAASGPGTGNSSIGLVLDEFFT